MLYRTERLPPSNPLQLQQQLPLQHHAVPQLAAAASDSAAGPSGIAAPVQALFHAFG